MTPVLLDTDIGSDIDDALALAYLLRQPNCELVGITTATGDTVKRAELAAWLCEAAGRPHIPVAAGLSGPILTGPGQPEVPQHAAFPGLQIPKSFDSAGFSAIQFLRETIRSRPGEITLLAIGPLTNVAALFACDPEIPALIRQVVLMCGTYGHTYSGRLCHTEWNAHCDPVAAAAVFHWAKPGSLVSVGLDVTLECKLETSEFIATLGQGHALQEAALSMMSVWSKSNRHVTLHDPLAAALVFEPGLCQFVAGQVDVSLDLGVTRWVPRPDGNHRIATAVDVRAFFEGYFRTVGGG